MAEEAALRSATLDAEWDTIEEVIRKSKKQYAQGKFKHCLDYWILEQLLSKGRHISIASIFGFSNSCSAEATDLLTLLARCLAEEVIVQTDMC